jgi:hypothetical protein
MSIAIRGGNSIANIPFTAAMLPVIGFLSGNIPGANSKVLFYCLSVGSAMGGNGSLIAASANIVTAGIAERAGSSITYMYFLKKGFPALLNHRRPNHNLPLHPLLDQQPVTTRPQDYKTTRPQDYKTKPNPLRRVPMKRP